MSVFIKQRVETLQITAAWCKYISSPYQQHHGGLSVHPARCVIHSLFAKTFALYQTGVHLEYEEGRDRDVQGEFCCCRLCLRFDARIQTIDFTDY